MSKTSDRLKRWVSSKEFENIKICFFAIIFFLKCFLDFFIIFFKNTSLIYHIDGETWDKIYLMKKFFSTAIQTILALGSILGIVFKLIYWKPRTFFRWDFRGVKTGGKWKWPILENRRTENIDFWIQSTLQKRDFG